MYKILVADDEEKLREAIGKYARFQGHEVVEATDGHEVLKLCREQQFHLILLDVMMPGMDGISTCRELRKICDTPVIMLTARGGEYDRILGFEAGVDDYVIKPFSPKELMLRMAAILKRNNPIGPEILNFEGITINVPARGLEVDKTRVDLTSKEYDVLVFLAKNSGKVVAWQDLFGAVWGTQPDLDRKRTIDTHIKQVRKALGPYNGRISTIRGIGYRFEEA